MEGTVGGRILGGPVIVGDLVFFSTLEQKTYAARVDNGRVVWRFPIGKYSPGIATERAYYFTLNGILVAFRGADCAALSSRVTRRGGWRRRQSGERCIDVPDAAPGGGLGPVGR